MRDSGPEKSRLPGIAIAVLIAYGFFTALISAKTVGVTFDETTFIGWGQDFLRTRNPFIHADHPPFSLWIGAFFSNLSKSDGIFFYRLPHVLIYGLSGVWAATRIQKHSSKTAALIFAALFAFDPFLKSMASLHVTDGTMTCLLLDAVIAYWAAKRSGDRRYLWAFGFFMGLAVSSKITALFWIPFFAIDWMMEQKEFSPDLSIVSRIEKAVPTIGAFILAGLLAYLGNWRFPLAWARAYGFSVGYNHNGHIAMLFGHYSLIGFRQYYLALAVFKSTPFQWIGFLVLSAVLLRKRWKPSRDEALLFLVAPALFFILLSLARTQVGYRYLLPAIPLVAVAIAWGAAARLRKLKPSLKTPLLATAILLAGIADMHMLFTQSYLPYFNFSAPSPTRNFADSNIDWHQGLPSYLRSQAGDAKPVRSLEEFLGGSEATTSWIVGPSELAGFWDSTFAPVLRALTPSKIVAGYEIDRITKDDLYLLMSDRPPLTPDTWSSEDFERLSVPLDRRTLTQRKCPSGERLETHSQAIAKILKTESTFEGRFEIPVSDALESILVVESNSDGVFWINGKQSGTEQRALDPVFARMSWFKVPLSKERTIDFKLSSSPQGGDRSLQAWALWQTCEFEVNAVPE